MGMDMDLCLHIITVTYLRYQNKYIQNKYHIIYHNSRILNIDSKIHMECGDTLHFIISIWVWIWIYVCILSLLHT